MTKMCAGALKKKNLWGHSLPHKLVAVVSCAYHTTHCFAYTLAVCGVGFLLQGDYRQLVHELDQYQYCELRLVVLDIRNTYVRHPLPLAYSWPSLTACILNLMIHTPCTICCFHALYFKLSGLGVKYACRVHRRERQLKWNPFLLNRRVIKLIAVLVLNWLALRLPSINQLVSFLWPLSSRVWCR